MTNPVPFRDPAGLGPVLPLPQPGPVHGPVRGQRGHRPGGQPVAAPRRVHRRTVPHDRPGHAQLPGLHRRASCPGPAGLRLAGYGRISGRQPWVVSLAYVAHDPADGQPTGAGGWGVMTSGQADEALIALTGILVTEQNMEEILRQVLELACTALPGGDEGGITLLEA